MPTMRHTFGNTDLRYGVKLGPAMLTGERVKTARQNREINQFRLESGKEEKERADANRQMWLEVKTPEEARKAFDEDPIYGAKMIKARKTMDDEELAKNRQYFGSIVQRLEPIVNLPQEQRRQAWDATWQSLPPGIQKKVPREYDERSVVAWIKQARGGAVSFKAYEDERKAVAMEKQKQEGREALQKSKTTLEAKGQTAQQMITNIGKHVDILFGEKANTWAAVSEEIAGGADKKKHLALNIKARALEIRRSGETNPFRAIQKAAKEILGIDIEGNLAIKATDENMHNVFTQGAAAPATAPQ